MNFVTVAEIRRSGFSILEAALAKGPVQLMKRNRPSAVLLSPADYETLLRQAQRSKLHPASTGLALLLNQEPAADGLDATGMQARLAELHESWSVFTLTHGSPHGGCRLPTRQIKAPDQGCDGWGDQGFA